MRRSRLKDFSIQEDYTSEKVLRLVDAEELGRSSVSDIRPPGKAQKISGYMKSNMTGPYPPATTSARKCGHCKLNHPR